MFSQFYILNVPICKLIIIVLLFYYAKINFVSKYQKNHCICKVLFTSKIRIKHMIICYKNFYTTYLLNWFVYCMLIWIRFENYYVLEFKYILYVFNFWNLSVWLYSESCQWGYTLVPKLVHSGICHQPMWDFWVLSQG